MPQRNIALQPRETAVTAALRLVSSVAGWCVTHTTDGEHATNSLHYVGRAVDLADFSGPGWDSPQLLAINKSVLSTLPLAVISELIYAGPDAVCVKNGKILTPAQALAIYGSTVLAEHHNHVHLGVVAGFTYHAPVVTPAKETTMPDVPPVYPVKGTLLAFVATPTGKGYWMVMSSGSVYAFGDATYFGGLAVTAS